MTKGAIFSDDRKYRYVLFRIWDDTKPKVLLIGLNPSTANENTNDNTITKVIKVAAHNGFGGIYMMNLFGLVSKDPDDLKKSIDPVGMNDQFLNEYSKGVSKIVFCWGSFKQAEGRKEIIMNMFPDAYCFKHTKNGSPWHPLYCLDQTQFIPFKK